MNALRWIESCTFFLEVHNFESHWLVYLSTSDLEWERERDSVIHEVYSPCACLSNQSQANCHQKKLSGVIDNYALPPSFIHNLTSITLSLSLSVNKNNFKLATEAWSLEGNCSCVCVSFIIASLVRLGWRQVSCNGLVLSLPVLLARMVWVDRATPVNGMEVSNR